MKPKILHVLLSIPAFLLLASRSCESGAGFESASPSVTEEKYAMGSILEEFETSYPTDEKLILYHEIGKEKMNELADYLSLYASSNTDRSFKPQIKDMIFRLFYDSTSLVQLSLPRDKDPGAPDESLAELLVELDKLPYQSLKITPSDLEILEPLHFENEGRYVGKLGCNIQISGIMESDTALLYQGLKQIEILAVPTEKQFGPENRVKVWQVFLTRIHGQDEAI